MCHGCGSGMLWSFKIDFGVSKIRLRRCLASTQLKVSRVRGGAVSLCVRLSDALEVLDAVVAEATVALSASRSVEVGRLSMVPYNA